MTDPALEAAYATTCEMWAAMNDKRYATNPWTDNPTAWDVYDERRWYLNHAPFTPWGKPIGLKP